MPLCPASSWTRPGLVWSFLPRPPPIDLGQQMGATHRWTNPFWLCLVGYLGGTLDVMHGIRSIENSWLPSELICTRIFLCVPWQSQKNTAGKSGNGEMHFKWWGQMLWISAVEVKFLCQFLPALERQHTNFETLSMNNGVACVATIAF